jgi:dTDP-L-rhamnose 4-epimerase
VVLVPVLLGKLWSVIPKLFEWPPARSLAHALERLSLLMLVVGTGKDFGDAPDYVQCNDLGSAVLLTMMARQRVRALGFGRVDGDLRGGPLFLRPARHLSPGPRRIQDLAAGHFEPACPRCASALTPELVSEDAPPDPRTVYAATKSPRSTWPPVGHGPAAAA